MSGEASLPSYKYKTAFSQNRESLINLGAQFFYNIDAQQLHQYDWLKNIRARRIYFSHPWINDANSPQGLGVTLRMLKSFFNSADKLQQPNDKILIARKKNNATGNNYYKGFYGFHVFTTDQNFKYKLQKKHKFHTNRYPGYNHVTTSTGGKSPFDNQTSLEYVFEKINFHVNYDSDREEDSDSDTEVSQLEAFQDLENRNRNGETLLHYAVKHGKLWVVEKLIALGVSINATDSQGRPPLFYVTELEDREIRVEIAKKLIEGGAEINYIPFVSPTTHLTPLLYARDKSREDLLQLYIERNPEFLNGMIPDHLNHKKLIVTTMINLIEKSKTTHHDVDKALKEAEELSILRSENEKLKNEINEKNNLLKAINHSSIKNISVFESLLKDMRNIAKVSSNSENKQTYSLNINSQWYTCRDITKILRLYTQNQLGGNADNGQYLLQKKFNDQEENFWIAITDAVDTVAEGYTADFQNIQVNSTPIAYYLDKSLRPPDELEEISVILLKSLNNVDLTAVKQQLETYHKAGKRLERLDFINEINSIPSTISSKLQEIINESQSLKKDVFDELMPKLTSQTNGQAKIIFPYNLDASHWLTAEIIIRKIDKKYTIEIMVHDPYGGGTMDDKNFKELKAAIEKRIKTFVSDASIATSGNKSSPYQQPRQIIGDTISCGIIMIEDAVKRIQGQSLNQATPWPNGAIELRKKHLKMIPENDNEYAEYKQRLVSLEEAFSNQDGSLLLPYEAHSQGDILSKKEEASSSNTVTSSNTSEEKNTITSAGNNVTSIQAPSNIAPKAVVFSPGKNTTVTSTIPKASVKHSDHSTNALSTLK